MNRDELQGSNFGPLDLLRQIRASSREGTSLCEPNLRTKLVYPENFNSVCSCGLQAISNIDIIYSLFCKKLSLDIIHTFCFIAQIF